MEDESRPLKCDERHASCISAVQCSCGAATMVWWDDRVGDFVEASGTWVYRWDYPWDCRGWNCGGFFHYQLHTRTLPQEVLGKLRDAYAQMKHTPTGFGVFVDDWITRRPD